AANIRKYTVIEGGAGFNTTLFGIARTLVRSADEYTKPNEKRLSEYTESERQSLELRLFSKRPLYPDYELTKLADSLSWMVEQFSFNHPLVQKVLAGESPQNRAADLINGTKLFEVAERERLYKGGTEAIAASKDPMIRLARLVDEESRKVRKIIET